jgi:ankyrin repeat protein
LNSESAVFYAVTNRHFEAVKALVEFGADLAITNSDDKTLLDVSKRLRHVPMLNYLKEKLGKLTKTDNGKLRASSSVELQTTLGASVA